MCMGVYVCVCVCVYVYVCIALKILLSARKVVSTQFIRLLFDVNEITKN